MGCLKNLIIIAVLVFATIGFNSVNGMDWVTMLAQNAKKYPAQNMQKAQHNIVDVSRLSEDFETKWAVDLMGIKALCSKNKPEAQKIIVLGPNPLISLSEEDFKNDNAKAKLNKLAQTIQYQAIRVEDTKLSDIAYFEANNKKYPYYNFDANLVDVSNSRKIKGLIGVVPQPFGPSYLFLTYTKKDEYSKKVVEDYLTNVTFK